VLVVSGGEPIDLLQVHTKRRRRQWRSGQVGGWNERHVCVGELLDDSGRWFVEDTKGPAIAYPTEQDAQRAADELMAAAATTWTEGPAEFDARSQPIGPWRRVGTGWERTD
jgi:hypothetical protein